MTVSLNYIEVILLLIFHFTEKQLFTNSILSFFVSTVFYSRIILLGKRVWSG